MASASGVPPPQGAAANSLEAMLAKKQQLDEDLRLVEKTIYETEEAYLEDTNHYGNVVRGWDGFLTSRPRPSGTSGASHHSSKRTGITMKERVFSISSTSAPVEGLLDDMDDMDGMGGMNAPLSFRGEGLTHKSDRRSHRMAKEQGDDSD